jgi:hypothetical protein
MLRIACLHTADSNIAVFEKARVAAQLDGVELSHVVRADLLAEAEASSGLTPAISDNTISALEELLMHHDAVLLTCSTLGPAADMLGRTAQKPVFRVDSALANVAVRGGGMVVALCAVETTVNPTRRLFEQAAQETGANVNVQIVNGAWDAFKQGDTQRYLQMIADAAIEAINNGADRVALAQASMAGAAELLPDGVTVLDSARQGLAAVAAAVE